MPTESKNTKIEQARALYLQERAAEEQRMLTEAAGVGEAFLEAAAGAGPHTPEGNDGADAVIVDAAAPDYGKEGQPTGKSAEVQVEMAPQLETAMIPAEFDESLLLDVYWANYGDASTRALLRNQPEDTSNLEIVIGSDDRQAVTNTRDYPWRCICSLLITAADGSSWIGTGWLVGPRILVTAGHCVYIHERGGWASRIEVIPGRKGAERPYGSCVSTSFRSVTGWTQNRDRNYDYGAILLPATCRYGDNLGWFGYAIRSDGALQGVQTNLSGYPGDKPSGTQWFMANTLSGIGETVITYMTDTAGGQSGAPVWITEADGRRYGVGIHTNGAITGNSATRINQAVFDNIKAWKGSVA